MLQILGYNPADLLDKSLYACHHGADSESLMAAFKNGKLRTLSSVTLCNLFEQHSKILIAICYEFINNNYSCTLNHQMDH